MAQLSYTVATLDGNYYAEHVTEKAWDIEEFADTESPYFQFTSGAERVIVPLYGLVTLRMDNSVTLANVGNEE